MTLYISLDNENRICRAYNTNVDGCFSFEFSDGFDIYAIHDYTIINGELAHDPIPAPTPEPTPQEQTDALMLDHEERLIYLELGVNNNAVSGS